ncbi:MAG: hypothetical protein K5981_02105 [Clostridia bacterium]|nr:hypothetical protein [Clostridia bacterium]
MGIKYYHHDPLYPQEFRSDKGYCLNPQRARIVEEDCPEATKADVDDVIRALRRQRKHDVIDQVMRKYSRFYEDCEWKTERNRFVGTTADLENCTITTYNSAKYINGIPAYCYKLAHDSAYNPPLNIWTKGYNWLVSNGFTKEAEIVKIKIDGIRETGGQMAAEAV